MDSGDCARVHQRTKKRKTKRKKKAVESHGPRVSVYVKLSPDDGYACYPSVTTCLNSRMLSFCFLQQYVSLNSSYPR
jgi:hypothetical protein